MKKTLLAVATSVALSPVYAYELINNERAYLDVYGEAKTRAFFYDNKDNDYSFGESKVGVDARYAVTDTTNVLGLVEAEINFDAEENLDEDKLYMSKYYTGVQNEVLGTLTFGKHSTSSDDMGGVDYSEAFGGMADLNAVSQHDLGLKYKYATELFTLSVTTGPEAGDFERDLIEAYGQYYLADLTFTAGMGKSTTNVATNSKDQFYALLGTEVSLGDYNLGASYSYNDTEDRLDSQRNVTKHGLALAAQLEIIEKLYGYTGYEYVMQSSDSDSLDGNLSNFYLGARYNLTEWADVYAEMNRVDAVNDETATNFAVGATVFW